MKTSESHSNPQIIVGLTGSIGSGKSEVAKILETLGTKIIDADVLAREITVPGSPALSDIKSTFGNGVFSSDGTLNRKALGSMVFADSEKRKKLESITHPRIRALFLEKINSEKSRSRTVVYVVPLLFETNSKYTELDKVVVVAAPKELCLSRIQKRDGCTRAEAEKRYDAQLPIEQKVAQADYVINNDGDMESLRSQTSRVFMQLSPGQ